MHKGCHDKLPKNCAGESEHPSSSFLGTSGGGGSSATSNLDSEVSTDSGNSKNSQAYRADKYGYNENVSDDEDEVTSPNRGMNNMMAEMMIDDYGKGQVQ